MPATIRTTQDAFDLAMSTDEDSTDALAAPSLLSDEPSGAGFVAVHANYCRILFFGTGDENSTFQARVFRWTRIAGGLWAPTLIADVTATLSATTGLEGRDDLSDSHRFADTLSLNAGDAGSINLDSPGSDLIAELAADHRGAAKLGFAFRCVTATAANAMVSYF